MFGKSILPDVVLQVIFEGITGTSYTGDIAIDDVEIMDGACPLPGLLRDVVIRFSIVFFWLFFDSLRVSPERVGPVFKL